MNTADRATMRGVPGDAARKRGLKRILLPVMFLALGLGTGLGMVIGTVLPFASIVGFILLGVTAVEFYIYFRRQPALVYGFFKGARGEEMAAGELSHLPLEWTVFNGVVLPNGHDIDHLAVGPQGVFVIETKHWSGRITIEKGEVLANGRTVNRSPVLQVRHAVKTVADATGFPQEIFKGVLCFAGSHLPEGGMHADEICVCSHVDLLSILCRGERRFSDVELARMVARLSKLTITEGL